ncbi:glycosyltransferase family 2 protein [Paenibacillus piri]|uniref:Glycosyltransferase family 2 protein n=1 Tax=Paenibacillus piri TaxID=2547395 RepID=A0A4R5KVV8_9BACL|nr:glycosyltransferase family 2 protein [Paenibacillus piri]TDF99255.1 glycosyltransferase family 2 protein [Paenibacillus piri]
MKQIPEVSVIIPAWNEAAFIAGTLQAVRQAAADKYAIELIVVDDGSDDATYALAVPWADSIVRHPVRRGKGAAMQTGKIVSQGQALVFLDADLGVTAQSFLSLLKPLDEGKADMTVARLPAAVRPGGFGLVKLLAGQGIIRLTGFRCAAPLSGQRAVRREVLERIGRIADGFGVEVGLTIDAVKLGYRVQEVEVPFAHRESGRDLQSWLHRFRQLCAVSAALWRRWVRPIC